jgi:decaprenyl-phosphate phosphoribosyltransferase
VPLSGWFLIVAVFGSLFMAAGKRASELNRLRCGTSLAEGELGRPLRRSLAGYTTGSLRLIWRTAAAIAVASYCVWAAEVGDRMSAVPWAVSSVAPFTLGVLRYAAAVERGAAETPEIVVLRDWVLLALGLLWAALFALSALGG